MISYTQGNLLESGAEALVNTVNTVGVMGKGIALMFRERFERNHVLYVEACKAHQLQTGRIFVTETGELQGPRWIINFPTKQHWRHPPRSEWIDAGLQDLKRFLVEHQVRSVAIPPLGTGNGGLVWAEVRPRIEAALSDLGDVAVLVYEPVAQYQNVAKRSGVESLTPSRALVAELVRRYWVLGMECSLLEIQKLAWFLERSIEKLQPGDNPLDLRFKPHFYGPFAPRLNKLLDMLDGSFLHCDKRIQDADKSDVIWFDESRRPLLHAYLNSEAKHYRAALEMTADVIDGFETPFGMELLASVDWLVTKERVVPEVEAVREGLKRWPAPNAGTRKSRMFDDRSIALALERLLGSELYRPAALATP